jgi:hypothetical protein
MKSNNLYESYMHSNTVTVDTMSLIARDIIYNHGIKKIGIDDRSFVATILLQMSNQFRVSTLITRFCQEFEKIADPLWMISINSEIMQYGVYGAMNKINLKDGFDILSFIREHKDDYEVIFVDLTGINTDGIDTVLSHVNGLVTVSRTFGLNFVFIVDRQDINKRTLRYLKVFENTNKFFDIRDSDIPDSLVGQQIDKLAEK